MYFSVSKLGIQLINIIVDTYFCQKSAPIIKHLKLFCRKLGTKGT